MPLNDVEGYEAVQWTGRRTEMMMVIDGSMESLEFDRSMTTSSLLQIIILIILFLTHEKIQIQA